MSDTKYNALVLGSSGLIGFETLNLLLNNNKYKRIYAVSRKELPVINDKLIQLIADYDSIESQIKDLKIDHLYSCMGTTAAKTRDKSEYYQIDLDYPTKVAQLLHKNGCQCICLVSSMGANSKSSNFYLKLKGKVEEAIIETGINHINIFRPSLLLGKRKEFRLMEKIVQTIYPFINFILIGKAKDYRSIQAKDVASAMINTALSDQTSVHIYQTQKIKELA